MDFLKGHKDYPISLITTYRLLGHFHPPKQQQARGPPDTDGVSFTNVGTGKGPRDKSKIICFAHGETGHFSYEKEKCKKQKGI